MSELINKVVTKHEIRGEVQITKVYPELENLTVTPTKQVQSFNHPDSYGYNNVVVKAIDCEPLSVVPQKEQQVFDGMYDKVNVRAIDCETLSITPKQESQSFDGMYDKVNVNAIQADTLKVTPSKAEQSFKGLYKQVNVEKMRGDTLEITPKKDSQSFSGIYETVNVGGIEPIVKELEQEILELETENTSLKTENTSLKRELEPYDDFVESSIGNPVYLNDSTEYDCEVLLVGNAEQKEDSTIETSGSNINILPNAITTVTRNGVTVTKNSDGSLTLNGTSTSDATFIDINNKSGYYLKFEAGKEYTISLLGNTWIQCVVRQTNQDTAIVTMGGQSKTFIPTYTGNCHVYIRPWSGMTFDNLTIYPKIEKGNRTPIYSPYGFGAVQIEVNNGLDPTDDNYQSYTKELLTQGEFAKVGDVADTFIKQDGKWYEQHNIGKISSYSGQTITTEYISTTGALTTGATVYYVLETPNLIECTAAQIEVLNSFHTYRNGTTISVNDIGELKVLYKKIRE